MFWNLQKFALNCQVSNLKKPMSIKGLAITSDVKRTNTKVKEGIVYFGRKEMIMFI